MNWTQVLANCVREDAELATTPDRKECFHLSVVFLEDIKLFDTTVNVCANIVPGVGCVVFLEIGVCI
jgi:hypothetical protein